VLRRHWPLSGYCASSQTFPVSSQLSSPSPGTVPSAAAEAALLAIVLPVFSLLSLLALRYFHQLSAAIIHRASLHVRRPFFQSPFSSFQPQPMLPWLYLHLPFHIPFVSASFSLLLTLLPEPFEHFPSPISTPSLSPWPQPEPVTLPSTSPHEAVPYASSHHLSISSYLAHAASFSAPVPAFLLSPKLTILSIHSST